MNSTAHKEMATGEIGPTTELKLGTHTPLWSSSQTVVTLHPPIPYVPQAHGFMHNAEPATITAHTQYIPALWHGS